MRRCPRGSGGIFLWRISGVRRGKQTTMFPATLDELIPLDHMCRNWRPFSSQSNSPKLATFAPLFKHLPTAHALVVTHRRARVRQCFADPLHYFWHASLTICTSVIFIWPCSELPFFMCASAAASLASSFRLCAVALV